MSKDYLFIIDFDSTFIQSEALDKLAEIVLRKDPQKGEKIQKIRQLTKEGMEGKIPFPLSLKKRLKLISANKKHIALLLLALKKQITPSIVRNKEFFLEHKDNIYIISGGFKDYIYPIVRQFGIEKNHVLANTFLFNQEGVIVGFDKKNFLSQEKGKVKQVQALHLNGEVCIIGDGITDYQIKEAGLAARFYAFTENISRPSVTEKADKIIKNFDEFLYTLRLKRALSYPKTRIKVLLLENIHSNALEQLGNEGYNIDVVNKSLSEKELGEKISDVSILGIRSKTEITSSLLYQAKRLQVIGAFCIGTNQIDLNACTNKGVAVFNAPYSNTRSVAEMIIGEIIMLSRRIPDKNIQMHNGLWDKSSAGCHEIRGKKLGIIGYGHIGSQVSVLAEAMGMEVYFYNTSDKMAFGNAKKCSTMEELVKTVDIITIHVSGKPENTNLINSQIINKMKDGVIILNASRGFIVDMLSLKDSLVKGKVAAAAIDVYPHEPSKNGEKFQSPLQGLPNVILTPHIGSGTEESQRDIGEFVSEKLISYINTGNTTLSVNLPNLQLPRLEKAHRFIHIHKNLPGVLAKINGILSYHGINIEGQYLQTNQDIGYVITDVNKTYDEKVYTSLKKIPETVRFRVLY